MLKIIYRIFYIFFCTSPLKSVVLYVQHISHWTSYISSANWPCVASDYYMDSIGKDQVTLYLYSLGYILGTSCVGHRAG